MYRLLFATAAMVTMITSGPGLAQRPDDGCTQRGGQWYCYPGAQPGDPFYGSRRAPMRAYVDDGCTQRRGQWYCYRGARPGDPFYGSREGGLRPYRDEYDDGRYYRRY